MLRQREASLVKRISHGSFKFRVVGRLGNLKLRTYNQGDEIIAGVLPAEFRLRIGRRVVWLPDGDGLGGRGEYRRCGRAA